MNKIEKTLAAAMEYVAEAEGQRLHEESEWLNQDPSMAAPESFTRRALETIDRAFKKE